MLLKPLSATNGLPDAEFISSSIANSTVALTTVAAPASIADGDLLIAVMSSDSNGRTFTLPSGFKFVQEYSDEGSLAVAKKTASSESGSYAFTGSAIDNYTVSILVYRNADTVTMPFVGTTRTESASATIAGRTITTGISGSLIAVFFAEEARTVSSAPSGMTQRAYQGAAIPSLAIYDLAAQWGGASGEPSITWNATSDTRSFLMKVYRADPMDRKPSIRATASTQSASAGVTTLVINKPTGTIEGDLMVAFMGSPASVTWTGATGWTEVADQGASPSTRIAYKVAGGSEPSSYTFTTSVSANTPSGSIVSIEGGSYDAISTINTSNPLVIPRIDVAVNYSLLLAYFGQSSASITYTCAQMDLVVQDVDATAPSYGIFSNIVGSGKTNTRTSNSVGGGDRAGIMLAVSPA